mmetsp:Transcript_85301/g.151108  ORF Transcript_85301/g.151108 Transcript_85301/m.151108 type:complete len:125 (+) Transcript_85301:143-517(+)
MPSSGETNPLTLVCNLPCLLEGTLVLNNLNRVLLLTAVMFAIMLALRILCPESSDCSEQCEGYTNCDMVRDTRTMISFMLGALHCGFLLNKVNANKANESMPEEVQDEEQSDDISPAQACAMMF